MTSKQQWTAWARGWLDGTNRSKAAAHTAAESIRSHCYHAGTWFITRSAKHASRAAMQISNDVDPAITVAKSAEFAVWFDVNIDIIAQKVLI